jgi:hypothetical protein
LRQLGATTAIALLLGGCESESRVEALPECRQSLAEVGAASIGMDSNFDRNDTPYDLVIVEVDEAHLLAEAVLDEDPGDEKYLDIELWTPSARPTRLPLRGDPVVALGGQCDNAGYARLTTPEGALLFEGGNAWCTTIPRAFEWDPPRRFSMRPAADANECKAVYASQPLSGDCCCVTGVDWEITLTIDGEEQVLPVGESLEVEIDGRPFLAEAHTAMGWFDGPCTHDVTSVIGSASLLPLE